MSKTLEGRSAFITGSASGIGLEIAKAFAAEGENIVISRLQAEPARITRPPR